MPLRPCRSHSVTGPTADLMSGCRSASSETRGTVKPLADAGDLTVPGRSCRAPRRVRRSNVAICPSLFAATALAVSWLADPAEGTGLSVRLGVAARRRRRMVAANPRRARPHRGRGRAIRRGRARLGRRRPAADFVVPYQHRSGRHRRSGSPDPRVARSADLRADALHPFAQRRRRAGIEARVNRAVYYELVALAVPEYVGPHLMLGVWSSGQFFPLGFMPDEDGEDEL